MIRGNYDLNDFTEEEISRVNELIESIRKEKEKPKKWMVVPDFDEFCPGKDDFEKTYHVEEDEGTYSKSRPPVRSGLNSKEEAEQWLETFTTNMIFNSALDEVRTIQTRFELQFENIINKLEMRIKITHCEWMNLCNELYCKLKNNKAINKVTLKE